MATDYRFYSMNGQTITVNRFSGDYDSDGIYRRVLLEVFDFYGSAQPYKTIEPTQMFSPPAGSRVDQRLYLYCDTLLFIEDSTQTQKTADRLIIDSRTYKPVSYENHNFKGCRSSHYRYVLELYDGD